MTTINFTSASLGATSMTKPEDKQGVLKGYLNGLENACGDITEFVDIVDKNAGSKKTSNFLRTLAGILGLGCLLITTKFAANVAMETLKSVAKKVVDSPVAQNLKNKLAANSGKIGKAISTHIKQPLTKVASKVSAEKAQSLAEWIFASATVTSSAINKLYDKVVKNNQSKDIFISQELPSLTNRDDKVSVPDDTMLMSEDEVADKSEVEDDYKTIADDDTTIAGESDYSKISDDKSTKVDIVSDSDLLQAEDLSEEEYEVSDYD